jgi:RNA-directed DNA polymerase
MKRYGNLWDQICDIENIKLAHKNASKGKSHYSEVKMVNSDPDFYLGQIDLNTFKTSKYIVYEKKDLRKPRTIYKLPYYPDRIVQHALLQVVGPIWTKRFIRDTFQSIKGRGVHDTRRRVIKHLKQDLYVLKLDIKKYYPSVDNEILKQEIRRTIKCKRTLNLIDNIINSAEGIPIGNYTSQFFGNLYLNRFDWYVKQTLKPEGYFRYCDDIVVLTKTKEECHIIREKMFKYLSSLNLEVNSTWQVFPLNNRPLDFVGFIFRPDKVTLRKYIASRLKQNMSPSYWGWCKYTKSKKLWLNSKRRKNESIRKLEASSIPRDRPCGSRTLGLRGDGN